MEALMTVFLAVCLILGELEAVYNQAEDTLHHALHVKRQPGNLAY